VEVWFVDLARSAALIEAREAAHPCLSPAEIDHAAALTGGPHERDLWRYAHIALRLVLERWAGERVRQMPYALGVRGKPCLPDAGPQFSLAHSGSAALIAVCESGGIGADIEAEERELKMSADRRSRLEAAGQSLAPLLPLPAEGTGRTLQAWVRFEAAAKADGAGVGARMGELRPVGGIEAGALRAAHAIAVKDVAVPDGYRAAVAAATLPERAAALQFPSTSEGLAAMLTGRGAVGR
jgi:4'-phosphopantetheinyl transferase